MTGGGTSGTPLALTMKGAGRGFWRSAHSLGDVPMLKLILVSLTLGIALAGIPPCLSDEPASATIKDRSVTFWIYALKSDDPIDRETAASALGRLGQAAA